MTRLTHPAEQTAFTLNASEMSAHARSTDADQSKVVIAHLTKRAQAELIANQGLRLRLAEAEAQNAALGRLIEKLEIDITHAKGTAETRALMSRNSEEKVMVLGTALTAAQRAGARQETLIADIMGGWSWRAGTPWRRLGRTWARTIPRRKQRRTLVGHFDIVWFVREYTDVRRLGADPFAHFMAHGLARDLNPNPCFDMRWYLKRHPDVANLGIHPLVHFQAHGFAEGRDPHPDVSCAAYRVRWAAGWDVL